MHAEMIEWIPFDRLENIEKIGEGGFGSIFSAVWLNGIRTTKDENGSYVNSREKSTKVALKTLSNSQEKSSDFLKEFKNHMECRLKGSELEIYGMTKIKEYDERLKLEAGQYLMVLQFADGGNLYNYLAKNFTKLTWSIKLLQLIDISIDLAKIHKAGYTHCDFHSGNILLHKALSYITDLGLSENIKTTKHNSTNEIFGVLPYVAPEVLLNGDYTPAADIYGLGIMMTEMSTGQRPFNGHDFNDYRFPIKICKGLRPDFAHETTPECFIELAKQCMDSDAQKRPTALDVALNLYNQYCYVKDYKKNDKLCIKDKYFNADLKILSLKIKPQIHPESTYISKRINTSKIVSEIGKPIDLANIPLDY